MGVVFGVGVETKSESRLDVDGGVVVCITPSSAAILKTLVRTLFWCVPIDLALVPLLQHNLILHTMSSLAPFSEDPVAQAHLRIARPTRYMGDLLNFYTDGLGFYVVGHFEKHAGFNGTMLGHPHLPYHLEFTEQEGHDPGRAPTKDHLLVFYLPEKDKWNRAVQRMEDAGFEPIISFNPYWGDEKKGKTFEDADGYRVVLWNGAWRPFDMDQAITRSIT